MNITLHDDSFYMEPHQDLISMLPTRLEGYITRPIDRKVASIYFEPMPETDLYKRVRRISVRVREHPTPVDAQASLKKLSLMFPKDIEEISVGSFPGMFYTDGQGVAAAVLARGRYSFEVVLISEQVKPSEQKNVLLKAAAAFITTR